MASSPMTSGNWAALLEPGLRAIFFEQTQATVKESPVPMLFNVTDSQKAVEHLFGVGGLSDVPVYNGKIEYDAFAPNYKTDISHQEYALGMVVERTLVDDDMYNVINQRATALGISFARTREKRAASIFGNAFSATDTILGTGVATTGADGVALCSASHPLGPTNATTLSNTGTLPLSYDNLITTRKNMRLFTDDRGQLIPANPDTLIVPPSLEDVAYNIMQSLNKPGTANNDANYVRGNGLVKNLIVWDYLPSSNHNWFYVDSQMAKMHLWWFQRVPLEFALDPKSVYDLTARYRGYERYSYGWDYPFWVYGHQVA